MACRIPVFFQKLFVIGGEVRGIVQLHLGDKLSVGTGGNCINLGSYVEDDRIVCRVLVMTMPEPVGSLLVYLYIPYPQHAAYLDFGIEKVGSCMGVLQSRVDDFNCFSIGGLLRFQGKKPVFPHVMQELFHVNEV